MSGNNNGSGDDTEMTFGVLWLSLGVMTGVGWTMEEKEKKRRREVGRAPDVSKELEALTHAETMVGTY